MWVLAAVAVAAVALAIVLLVRGRRDHQVPDAPEVPASLAEVFHDLRLVGPASARVLAPLVDGALTADTMDRINQQVGITAPGPVMTRSMLTDLLARLDLIETETEDVFAPGQVSEWEDFLDRQMSRFEKSQRTRLEELMSRPVAPKLPRRRPVSDPATVRPVVGALPDDVKAMSQGKRLEDKARRRLEQRRAPEPKPEPKHITVTRGSVLPGMSWRELGLPEDIPEAFLS